MRFRQRTFLQTLTKKAPYGAFFHVFDIYCRVFKNLAVAVFRAVRIVIHHVAFDFVLFIFLLGAVFTVVIHAVLGVAFAIIGAFAVIFIVHRFHLPQKIRVKHAFSIRILGKDMHLYKKETNYFLTFLVLFGAVLALDCIFFAPLAGPG